MPTRNRTDQASYTAVTPDRGSHMPILQFTTPNPFNPIAEAKTELQTATATTPFGAIAAAVAAVALNLTRLFASKILGVNTTINVPQEISVPTQPT